MKWFRFWDMSSGGYEKTDYSMIFVKAKTQDEAVRIFEMETDLNPYDVTCECCGEDFAIDEVLEEEVEKDESVLTLGDE